MERPRAPEAQQQKATERQQSIPMIAFIVLALLGQFFFAYSGDEPYPSIAMPGFEGVEGVSDDPKVIPLAYLRLESSGRSTVLSRSELFESAPPGQQNRMMERLGTLSGTDAEWAFFDTVAQQHGLGPVADTAELIRRDGYGSEYVELRIERS